MHDLELFAFGDFGRGGAEILRGERIQTFPAPQRSPPSLADVTLVTQFSVNRFERFQGIVANWRGPISVVIHLVNPWDIFTFWDFLLQSTPNSLENVTFTVYQPDYRVDFRHYPINRLRNLGILAAVTDTIFVIDADFRPNTGLYPYLAQFVVPEIQRHSKLAYVVAGLAVVEEYQGKMPDTVEELRILYQNGTSYITSLIGHGSTKYEVFLDQ